MTLPIYLQEGPPHDPGWTAWALDLLGFATWAPTEAEVLARLPAKLTEYADWLRSRGQSVLTLGPDVAVVERVSGDEVLFSPDHLAATPHEIDRTIELIGWSRQDLLAVVEGLPDELLDWDPPYKRFPAWADWRTIRQVLRHIALTEVGYYLRWIGYDPAPITNPPAGWRSLLDATRARRCAFSTSSRPLRTVAASSRPVARPGPSAKCCAAWSGTSSCT